MIDDRPAPADVQQTANPLRIAFVYCRNPLPMRRADQITVAHLLEFLAARGHTVDLFCFDGDAQTNSDNAFTAADIEWLQEKCRAVTFVRQSRARAFLGAMSAMLSGKPLQVGWLTNRRLAKALAASLETQDYDILYSYYFRSAETALKATKGAYRSGRPTVPTVLAMQLSQTLNTRRIRDNATNFPTRLVFSIESRLVARYEARVWRRFDRTALIGPADVSAISEVCRTQGLPEIDNWFYSPHGTDINRFKPRPSVRPAPNTVLFAGTLFYPPNIQAASWLVREVWPLVRAKAPEATLTLVGRDPAAEVRALASEVQKVQVVGSVPDISEYMLGAAVCVNPVRAAGGMQNKLIEYLASGRPVVSTRVANEGIGAPSAVLELADTPEQFSDAIVRLLQHPDDAERMGGRAREYAWQWSWEAHFLELERNIRRIALNDRADVD